jgi:hypothetical protein
MSFRIPHMKKIDASDVKSAIRKAVGEQYEEVASMVPLSSYSLIRSVEGEEEGMEITCFACGLWSGASGKYPTPRVPMSALVKGGYECPQCSTKYMAEIQDTHWHIKMQLPENLKSAMEEAVKKSKKVIIDL